MHIKCAIPVPLEINQNFSLVTFREFSLKYAVYSILLYLKTELKKRKARKERQGKDREN